MSSEPIDGEAKGLAPASTADKAPVVHRAALAALSLGALGVVFGDIGTSPLYTLKTKSITAYPSIRSLKLARSSACDPGWLIVIHRSTMGTGSSQRHEADTCAAPSVPDARFRPGQCGGQLGGWRAGRPIVRELPEW